MFYVFLLKFLIISFNSINFSQMWKYTHIYAENVYLNLYETMKLCNNLVFELEGWNLKAAVTIISKTKSNV